MGGTRLQLHFRLTGNRHGVKKVRVKMHQKNEADESVFRVAVSLQLLVAAILILEYLGLKDNVLCFNIKLVSYYTIDR